MTGAGSVSKKIAAAALALSMALGGTASAVTEWASVTHGLQPHNKSAYGYATDMSWDAEFRVSADCPGPDRHSGWENDLWHMRYTGKCHFWRTASSSYWGLR